MTGPFLDGVRLAWGTLTAIPGPPPSRVDAGVARVAMASAWLVLLPLTLVVGLVGWLLAGALVPPVAAGLLTIGVLQLATNGIHADGLADTFDGLWSGRTPERALEIMRRGDIGPMGGTALIVVLGTEAILLGEILEEPRGWLLAGLALACGRLGLTLGTRVGVRPARADGLGQAMAGSVPTGLVAAVWLAAAVLGTLVASWPDEAYAWWAWPLGLGLGALGCLLLLARAKARVGGITGDVLGALVETTTLGVLLGLALG